MAQVKTTGGVQIQDGRTFRASAQGYWAGLEMARAVALGRPFTAEILRPVVPDGDIRAAEAALRTGATLRRDEWVFFDEQLVAEAMIRLRGVADLIAAGLVRSVANALGKTLFEYEKVSDMEDASVSMDGLTTLEGDRQEFTPASVPLPITHKDFRLNLRTLIASRERGEPLDTMQVRTAGRKVAEALENMLFNGGLTAGGYTIYGYRTHPDRNTGGFGTNGAWSQAAKTGENILADVQTMISALEADRMYGPYWLYVSRNQNVKLDGDFKAASDKTIRMRLEEIDGLRPAQGGGVRVSDQLPNDNVVLVQATMDVVAWVMGEQIQTVQWDVHPFQVAFKAFALQVPLIRSDARGRSGVFHMS